MKIFKLPMAACLLVLLFSNSANSTTCTPSTTNPPGCIIGTPGCVSMPGMCMPEVFQIANGGTKALSDANVNTNGHTDSVNFSGNDTTGTLSVNASKSLTGITVANNGSGTVQFGANNTLTITGNIGSSSSALGRVLFNSAGTFSTNDSYISAIDFANASDTASLAVASSKTLNVLGNISKTGAGTSAITGGSGTLVLGGSSAQTMASGVAIGGNMNGSIFGTVTINNSAGVTFNENVFATSLIQTSGAITIAKTKTINIINALNLSGKTININFNAGENPGKIVTAGLLTLSNSTTLNVNYSGTVTAGDYVVATGGSVSGSASDVTLGGTGLSSSLAGSLVLIGNDLKLRIAAASSGGSSSNSNRSRITPTESRLLDDAAAHTGISSSITSGLSANQIAEGVKTLKPRPDGAIAAATNSVVSATANVASSRMGDVSSGITGFSSGNKSKIQETGIWGQVFGNRSKQGIIKGVDGYNSSTKGLMFGNDYLLEQDNFNMLVGGAVAYGVSDVKSNANRSDTTTIDSYQTIFYNKNSAKNGLGFYNDNIINLSYNRYDTLRNISIGSFNERASAKFDGYSYGLRSGVGYNKKLSDKFLLSPNFALKYSTLTQEQYAETGSSAALKVDNKDFDSLFSETGISLTSKFKHKSFTYVPSLTTSWEHNLNNAKQKSSVVFVNGGSRADNNSEVVQTNKYNFGASLNVAQKENTSLQFEYNLQIARKFSSNGASLKYRYVF